MSAETSEDGRQTPATTSATATPQQQPMFLHPSALFAPPIQLQGNPWPTPTMMPPMLALPPPEGSEPGAPLQYVMLAPGPGMMYAFPPVAGASAYPFGPDHRPKRKQVKRACQNCANACKRCDEARPCQRCQKYGIADTCEDQQRKERQKGIKRGPYKRKDKNVAEPSGSGLVPMPEGTMWPQPLMIPFPTDPEAMQPYMMPPGLFPSLPNMDPNAAPAPQATLDQNAMPHPAPFYPFPFGHPFHGFPQFASPPNMDEPDQSKPAEDQSAMSPGSSTNPLGIEENGGIDPSQLERSGSESLRSSGL